MKQPRTLVIAILGYTAWALSLYFIATTSYLLFLASGAIAGGVSLPATWWSLQNRQETSKG
jgi:hypothetical protein